MADKQDKLGSTRKKCDSICQMNLMYYSHYVFQMKLDEISSAGRLAAWLRAYSLSFKYLVFALSRN